MTIGPRSGPRVPAGLAAYAGAATVARTATEAIAPAVLLVAVAEGLDPSRAAELLSCYVVTGALAGPFVGQLLDRTAAPRRLLAVAMTMIGLALIALAAGLGHWPFWLLALLAGLAGLGQPAPTSGWTAQLPRVVTGSSLGGAYGVDAATYNVGMIAGPAIAGVAFALSHRAPLVVPAAFLVLAMFVLTRIKISDRGPVNADTSIRHGFVVLVRSPRLLRGSIVSTVGFAGQAAVVAAAPVISRDVHRGLALVGPLLVAFAVGGLLSTLYFARRPARDPDRWIDLGTWIVMAGFVVLALAHNPVLALAGSFVIGAGDGPMFTSTLRVRAREAPAEVRGQVFATAASIRVAAYALALALFGAQLAHGATVVLWTAAGVQVVAIVLGLAVSLGTRRAQGDAAGWVDGRQR